MKQLGIEPLGREPARYLRGGDRIGRGEHDDRDLERLRHPWLRHADDLLRQVLEQRQGALNRRTLAADDDREQAVRNRHRRCARRVKRGAKETCTSLLGFCGEHAGEIWVRAAQIDERATGLKRRQNAALGERRRFDLDAGWQHDERRLGDGGAGARGLDGATPSDLIHYLRIDVEDSRPVAFRDKPKRQWFARVPQPDDADLLHCALFLSASSANFCIALTFAGSWFCDALSMK